MRKVTKHTNLTRHQFLGTTTAAVAAFTILPRHVLGGPKYVAPNDRVNIAVIGAGGQGRYYTQFMLKEPDAQMVAVCDPYEQWDRGAGGRKPLKAEIEKLYLEKNVQRQCNDYADPASLVKWLSSKRPSSGRSSDNLRASVPSR
jgi:hypothetical protein